MSRPLSCDIHMFIYIIGGIIHALFSWCTSASMWTLASPMCRCYSVIRPAGGGTPRCPTTLLTSPLVHIKGLGNLASQLAIKHLKQGEETNKENKGLYNPTGHSYISVSCSSTSVESEKIEFVRFDIMCRLDDNQLVCLHWTMLANARQLKQLSS